MVFKKRLLESLLIAISAISAYGQTLGAMENLPNTFTAANQFTLPVTFGSGTANSQGNECASTLAAGSLSLARTVDGSSVGHDLFCGTSVKTIIFPSSVGIYQSTVGRNNLILTNLGTSVSRGNSILWRSCIGGCGTDFNLFTDGDLNGSEDVTWVQGTSISNLYFTGNCPVGCAMKFGPLNGTVGIKQFFISDSSVDARINPEFGLVSGHIAHGSTGVNPDNWGTVALTGGTGTYSFVTAWQNAPLCLCNNPNQSGAPIACSASASTTVLTLKSGGGTDTVNYSCMGNPY